MLRNVFFFLAAVPFLASCLIASQKDMRQAEAFYKAARYKDAIRIYESLIRKEKAGADVYYNLGNAYFKDGQLAPCIVNYERAYRLTPDDPDLIHNLNVARARLRDRVTPLPLLFFVQWWNDIKEQSSLDTLFFWSVGLLWGVGLLVFVFFGFAKVFVRRIAFSLGIVVAGLFIASVFLVMDKNEDLGTSRYAVIAPIRVAALSAPDASGVESFAVHEGLKVEIVAKQNGWRRIRLADGKQGWVKEGDLLHI